MIPKQMKADAVFTSIACERSGGYEALEFADDIATIRRVLKEDGCAVSVSEAAAFWSWRSQQYDATWLVLHDDDEIREWFDKFIEHHANDDDWFERFKK